MDNKIDTPPPLPEQDEPNGRVVWIVVGAIVALMVISGIFGAGGGG